MENDEKNIKLMSSEEIKEEAKKRREKMTDQEKKDMWGFSQEDNDFLDYVMDVGSSKLTSPADIKKFRDLVCEHVFKTNTNGVIQAGMEYQLEKGFNITVDDIKKGVKNPYKARIFRDIILAALVNVTAAVFAISGNTPLALGVETTTGIFAMDFATQLKNYFDFKKLQKNYMSGKFEEKQIAAEVFNQEYEERQKRWNR